MYSRMSATATRVDPARQVQRVMAGLLVSMLAVISLSTWAQTPPPMPAGREHGMQYGQQHDKHRGMHQGMHRGMHHGMGPEAMFRGSPERMNRMIDRMLDGLGTSDAQRTQIKQIAAAAAADLRAQAATGHGLREQSMRIFTAPTVDANAAEQLRQQRLQQHDQMSRRMTQAMLDASRVLTPEQRAKVGERMRDRQARRDDRMKRMGEPMKERQGERR